MEIEQILQELAYLFAELTEAIRSPEKTIVDEPGKVVQFPHGRKPVRPRVQRFVPLTRWPSWGTEHVMTCTKRGCITCRRLATVKVSL